MKAELQFARPGVSFKNGKLYDFSTRRIVVLRGWPEPMAWVKTPKRPWRGTRKWADEALVAFFRRLDEPARRPAPLETYVLAPGTIAIIQADGLDISPEALEEHRIKDWKSREAAWKERTTCIEPFSEQIPAEIRALIAPLQHRAWHLLCMFARCPGAVDLFRSNPALAFALSGHWFYREHRVSNPIRATRRLVYKRQRDILAWMGFPGTKSVQQMFRKIPIDHLHPALLKRLQGALLDPRRGKVLAHLPALPPEVLSLVVHDDYFDRLSMRFFMEMLENRAAARDVRWLLRDTLRMNHQIGGGDVPARFHSLRRLREMHDDLVAPVNDIMLTRKIDFPEPPYVGTDAIVPLCTLKDLVEEGIQMRHCVAAYANRVAGGAYYVYRVLKPVRATLAIFWYKNHWECSQLMGFGNLMLARADREAILTEFFDGVCVRGAIKSTPDEREDWAVGVEAQADPVPFDEAIPPEPWVPCDRDGHPLLVFSDAARSAVETIRTVFSGRRVAS